MLKKNLLWSLLFVSLLALDLSTKLLAIKYLTTPVIIIPDFFKLALTYNTGIAFSIPIPNAFMIIVSPLLLIGLSYLIMRSCNLNSRATKLILALIIAGGTGNFINRLTNGAVIDFLNFSFWPSFNFADAYLTIGVFLLILFYGKVKTKNLTYG